MLITPEMVQAAKLRLHVPVVLIEEDDYVLNQLRAYLSELEAMAVPPPAGSPEALADHDNWMKTREQIRRIVRMAEWSALLTVPSEVTEVLKAIDARKAVLMHLPHA